MYEQFDQLDARKMAPGARVRCERRELGIDMPWWARSSSDAGVFHAASSPRSNDTTRRGPRTRGSDPARRPGRPPRPGRGCPADAMVDAAFQLGLERDNWRPPVRVSPLRRAAPTRLGPCPLSVREVDALRGLAEGKVTSRSPPSCRCR